MESGNTFPRLAAAQERKFTMGKLNEITDGDFDNEVIKSDQPVLVDFFATWCPPCQRLLPILEQLAAEYEGRVKFVKLNTDEQKQWASKLGVRGLPTLCYFNKGEPVAVEPGLAPPAKIKSHLDKMLAAV